MDTLLAILAFSPSQEQFKTQASQQISISFLRHDLEKMLTAQKTITEEKQLELKRLESFAQKNDDSMQENIRNILELTIRESLRQNSTLSSADIMRISRKTRVSLFEQADIFLGLESFAQQESMIVQALQDALWDQNTLSPEKQQNLINLIIDNIKNLEILAPESESPDDELSLLQRMNIFSYAHFSLIATSYANDDSMSQQQRAIRILKAEIQIQKILQASINAEIQKNRNEIGQSAYNSLIQDNLVELEELVILKTSLEEDEDTLSLSEIQRLRLWEYIDDSSEIESLPVIAYVQDKVGHIVISNHNGSSRLWGENMSLYSGYSIETLSNASATIIFSDESILRLEPSSRVTISSPSEGDINVELWNGSIWTRVVKPILSGDVFTIQAWDDVSLWVRGTAIALTMNPWNSSEIQIVDSYSPDSASSVTLTDASGTTQLSAQQQISIDNVWNSNISNQNTAQLLQARPELQEFLRDDLSYLSLLLDDRKRGFYNTPITSNNDDDAFLQKILWELEESLPNSSELPYIIQNPEIRLLSVGTGSIYHRIQQDILISKVKTAGGASVNTKVSAIAWADFQRIQDELWSQRTLDNYINYNIAQNIIDTNFSTSQELEQIFIWFPIEQAQNQAEILSRVQRELSPNAGNTIATRDIDDLALNVSGVDISWETSSWDIISKTGRVSPQENSDSTAILTATLSIWNLSAIKDFKFTVPAWTLTPLQELEQAKDVLDAYINLIGPDFIDEIILQTAANDEFIAKWVTQAQLTWSGEHINNTGTTNRPEFADSPDQEHKQVTASVTLIHPEVTDVELQTSYTIWIKRKDPPAPVTPVVTVWTDEVLDEEPLETFATQVADTTFPDCDTPDILLSNGQVWAMCNAGSQVSGTSTSSYGEQYLYRGWSAINACNIDGYKLPNKSDWESTISILGGIDEVASTLKLPKAWGIWRKYFFWDRVTITNEKRYWSSTEWNDDEYYTLTDSGLIEEPRRSKFSVRCIRDTTIAPASEPTGPTIEDLAEMAEAEANNILQSYKEDLKTYFTGRVPVWKTLSNIKNRWGFPAPPSWVSITWSGWNPYMGEAWNISSPSFNTRDQPKTLQATLSHNDTDTTIVVDNLLVKFMRADCDGTEIWGDCYELVAEADYNEAWKYNLMDGTTTKVIANVWNGVDNNILNLQDNSRGITELNELESHVQVWNQKWIYIDNQWSDDYLSYDLSSLIDEDDDWAIEMSVRGQDLKRDHWKIYILLNIENNFTAYNLNWNFKLKDRNWLYFDVSSIVQNNTFNKIYITKKHIIINGNKKNHNMDLNINDISNVNTSKNDDRQWNWILNYFRIYNKK